jgi:DNA-directed RNA polymerase specialized sigma24 family protein
MSRQETMQRVVRQVAGYYAKRVWWADKADLEQEAWVHVLEAASWYEGPDAKFAGYIYSAASRNLSRYMRAQSAPVSGRDKKTEGMHRTEFDDQQAVTETPEHIIQNVEAQHQVKSIRVELRWHVEDLYRSEETPRWKPKAAEIDGVMRVLLDGEQPAAAAKVAGIPVRALYSATEWVKKCCVQDATIRDLLTQLHERRSDIGKEI